MSTSSAPHSVSGPAPVGVGVRLRTHSSSERVWTQEMQHIALCSRGGGERVRRGREREREIGFISGRSHV